MRFVLSALLVFALVSPGAARTSKPRPVRLEVMATAHSQDGISASGAESRRGTVAADPRVIPIGSRILVKGAGRYSGEYLVIDTGAAINGREIDIYIPAAAEAKRFGRRRVTVTILERGHNEKLTAGGQPAGGKAAISK